MDWKEWNIDGERVKVFDRQRWVMAIMSTLPIFVLTHKVLGRNWRDKTQVEAGGYFEKSTLVLCDETLAVQASQNGLVKLVESSLSFSSATISTFSPHQKGSLFSVCIIVDSRMAVIPFSLSITLTEINLLSTHNHFLSRGENSKGERQQLKGRTFQSSHSMLSTSFPQGNQLACTTVDADTSKRKLCFPQLWDVLFSPARSFHSHTKSQLVWHGATSVCCYLFPIPHHWWSDGHSFAGQWSVHDHNGQQLSTVGSEVTASVGHTIWFSLSSDRSGLKWALESANFSKFELTLCSNHTQENTSGVEGNGMSHFDAISRDLISSRLFTSPVAGRWTDLSLQWASLRMATTLQHKVKNFFQLSLQCRWSWDFSVCRVFLCPFSCFVVWLTWNPLLKKTRTCFCITLFLSVPWSNINETRDTREIWNRPLRETPQAHFVCPNLSTVSKTSMKFLGYECERH